ncbi:hypothetical protein HanRHA438_Chr05g0247011 [Helianthus annuus]|uniref:uncharacterized protein LOC110942427 isoform X3 n=1 Tax=Helianthus annuus TaxID=4232 RepID=UPI000B8FA259|nr:uncharacterized protein LOC110942427 isoform X3 [Helianthus annuus]KAJ0920963.1 hypothetical protein HanRHA438_Chr05g0247011 [Helianthus annuus]
MENGVRFDDGSNLTERLANLSVGDGVNGCRSDVDNINGVNKSDGLFQVMKAVEAAEATIKQQMEENQRLRSELQKRDQELEDYLVSEMFWVNTVIRFDWMIVDPLLGNVMIGVWSSTVTIRERDSLKMRMVGRSGWMIVDPPLGNVMILVKVVPTFT